MKDGDPLGIGWTRAFVMGSRTSVLWENGSDYVKMEVRPKENERGESE